MTPEGRYLVFLSLPLAQPLSLSTSISTRDDAVSDLFIRLLALAVCAPRGAEPCRLTGHIVHR